MNLHANAWKTWGLGIVTLGIYNALMYSRWARELSLKNGHVQAWYTRMWAVMFIPFCYFVAMSKVNSELNEVLVKEGQSGRSSFPMTLLASMWFSSDTRYLQRRVNLVTVQLAN